MENAEDKRIFCRFVLPDIPLRFKDLKVGDRGTARVKNISGSGLGMDSHVEVKPKTPLEMWLDLSDGFEPLHLMGRVAWVKRDGEVWQTGVAFNRQKLISMARIMRLEYI